MLILNENMTVIGGIPLVKCLRNLLKSQIKTLAEIFKNLSLYVFGGVNMNHIKKHSIS